MHDHEYFMNIALHEALYAYEEDEVPVGAVMTKGDTVVARAHNASIARNDPSAHAEMLVIREVSALFGNYRLGGTTLYVTLEPCVMCAGAIIQARIPNVVFGAFDPKGGAVRSCYRILDEGKLNHVVEVVGGVLHEECGEVLSRFFREKRVSTP
jgi:tRNA(adenine34) deaminase